MEATNAQQATMTRRQLVAGGVTAMALASTALAARQVKAAEGNGGRDTEWDEEADVVVVGYSFAGSCAAIAAAEAGATVIVLEKAPEDDAGGNSSCCGGGCQAADPDYPDENMSFLNFQMPDTIEEEEKLGFLDELYTNGEWLEDHGLELNARENHGGMYNKREDAVGFNTKYYPEGNGHNFYMALRDIVETTDNIEVEFETAGVKLVFDPATKEVLGVIAVEADGTLKNVKAKRGVVMALGGFENSHYYKTTFMPPEVPVYPCGTPYNTGDGIGMVEEVGAKLRGFSSTEWGCHACKPASDEIGVHVGHNWTDLEVYRNSIIVNARGERFVNEAVSISDGATSLRPIHDKSQLPELAFDMNSVEYKNLPFFMVCDSARFNDGPLFSGCNSQSVTCWSHVHDWYTWSDDNQAEVDRGWIQKGDTLEELAEKLGIDPEGLAATVEKYNGYCEAGADPDFNRELVLTPVSEPPFYGCELGMSIINTQGGPVRDGSHHVIDTNGDIVPRLYSGGEFGSIYVFLYQGAGNVPEAVGCRVAGANAAAETPWDE